MKGVSNVHVIIMCKAPVAGRVKTRLIGRYSADQAATLHAEMAEEVVSRAARLFDNVLISADDPGHPFFSRFNLPVISQGEGNLGDRMHRMMVGTFADGAEGAMFLGTDSPHMQDERLIAAAEMLQSHDVVLGPVEDGGYDLIAMASAYPLFDQINWSSPEVLAQTLKHVQKFNLSCAILDTEFDIDYPEDLERAGWRYA
ncbi:hypothetical protein Ga0123462_0938 [Mariprofundus ferrinatatus]|uniref:Glycosyltransferase n=1 Tax=Mariprofundus ferrinatatus TaxID=1921087 RepID=A0A2K8L3F3_9PROT|nr:TIGR04282 family arsenosugar biosynthesis glycosyltransferase [Mariprofundus ferrinatatus]ATX81807.1 hypothetical protein Ga0123462_0938 [Mariprofundus ferrinatatus]